MAEFPLPVLQIWRSRKESLFKSSWWIFMWQNVNIIVYIWSPNLAICAIAKIGGCTRLLTGSPVENRSCSESTRCIVFNVWYRSAAANPFQRVGHDWVVRTSFTTVGGGRCLWDSQACVRDGTRNVILAYLELTLMPVAGDMFSCLIRIK